MEPASLMLDQTQDQHRIFVLFSVFLERPPALRENPTSAHAQSTSGLNSQTSHHSTAEHNVTHVGVHPALSRDPHAQNFSSILSYVDLKAKKKPALMKPDHKELMKAYTATGY